jgi:hypothetical protein
MGRVSALKEEFAGDFAPPIQYFAVGQKFIAEEPMKRGALFLQDPWLKPKQIPPIAKLKYVKGVSTLSPPP